MKIEKTKCTRKRNRKNKLDAGSFRENRKEFIKNNKLVLKSQQSFSSIY